MNNRERAVKIIHHMTGDLRRAHDVVEEIAQTSLLAPDLPEPQEHGGELIWPLDSPDGWAVTATDDYVRLSDERGAIITINRKLARDLGSIFTAAARAEGSSRADNLH